MGEIKFSGESGCVAIIMAGGSGTRFWPQSRSDFPKQFLKLRGDELSLLQGTFERVKPLVGANGAAVVTLDRQTELVSQQLPTCALIAEPEAKNTAACLGLAAVQVLAAVGDIPMVCVPSDHIVNDERTLLDAFRLGVKIAAQDNAIVTVGISATRPETGYGYIKRGNSVSRDQSDSNPELKLCEVDSFVEKPDAAKAAEFVNSGQYYWNAGMFVFRPSTFLELAKEHMPKLCKGLDQILSQWRSGSIKIGSVPEPLKKLTAEIYNSFESVSFDKGIVEKAGKVFVIGGKDIGWSDVGSWEAWSELRVEGDGNYCEGNSVFVSSKRCTVVSSPDKLVAVVGLKDVVVVDCGDALLVCDRSSSQNVREVVDELRKTGRNKFI
jgi:mannose-1-phosphate guanylyltransferase